ncbi:MAG: carboxypeptidase-like regulatory domain-containing protein [Ignavibacteriota bacterium]
MKFVLSKSPATIGGIVKNASGDAVAGVKVFVEPFDLEVRKRLLPMRSVTADAKGRYTIGGLAPGVYRVLASFDYLTVEPAQMDAANAPKITVEDGAHAVLDLEEFVIH